MSAQEFCGLLTEQLDGIRRMALSLSDPMQLRALAQGVGAAFARAAPAAPPDARPDLGILASTIADYRASLDNSGYDVTKLSPDMVTKLQSPPVVEAMSRLGSWIKSAC